MAETKTIAIISVVTDSETGYDNIGDITGGFEDTELEKVIRNHGYDGLLKTLSWMNFQVWEKVREHNKSRAEKFPSAESQLKPFPHSNQADSIILNDR